MNERTPLSNGPRLIRPVTEADHRHGPSDAPVSLIQYGDYECPYCGRAYPIIESIREELGNQLQFVFRNFPVTSVHPHAQHAAEAAEAAGAQSEEAFWAMHDTLYEHQDSLADDDLRQYARDLDLDMERFEKEVFENHDYVDRIQEDFMTGVRSGVNGTPTFFINGVRHDRSWDRETLLTALEEAARVND